MSDDPNSTDLERVSSTSLGLPQESTALATPTVFAQWKLAWSEFGRRHPRLSKSPGVLALLLFTILGLSPFAIVSYFNGFLPWHVWFVAAVSLLAISEMFVIRFAGLAHQRAREELSAAHVRDVQRLERQIEALTPSIRITIKDVCDQTNLPLNEGFRFNHHIFIRLHLVNRAAETNIQEFTARLWVNDVEYTGKQRPVSDYRLLVEEQYRDSKKVTPSTITRRVDLHDLEATKQEPLKQNIGREGWISFLFVDVELPPLVDGYRLPPERDIHQKLEIVIIDGRGEPHTAESEGPWKCPGQIAERPPEFKPIDSPFDVFR